MPEGTPNRFKVMLTGLSQDLKEKCPASIPWNMIAPHELQAQRNHSQTLLRLHHRGGCSPGEIYLIMHDQEWNGRSPKDGDDEDAIEWLRTAVVEFEGSQRPKIGELVDGIPSQYEKNAWAMFLAGVSVGQKYGDELRSCPEEDRVDILTVAFKSFWKPKE